VIRTFATALCSALLCVSVARAQSAGQQDPAGTPGQKPEFGETVAVVGVTPLHGLGVPIDQVPGNVQTLSSAQLSRAVGSQVTDVMIRRLTSVGSTETQANPFQPDIQFRGFSGSPLLGAPQGIAVYQDGVRVNEPFGDAINWDLLPATAVSSMNLMPGSNPLFGLNALGGALSIQTKSGFTDSGHQLSISSGSFGRVWADGATGGHGDRFSYFLAGHVLSEDGWRDFSPSRIGQLFGKSEWRGDKSSASLSLTFGDNRLVGNGPAPVQLLDEDRSEIFTHPDITDSRVAVAGFGLHRASSPTVAWDSTLYIRPARIETFNGDDTSYAPCSAPEFAGRLCSERDDEPVVDQNGQYVNAADAPFDATNNTSETRTLGWGGAIQTTRTQPLAGRNNHFVAGGTLDVGASTYSADSELANLTDSRGTTGTGRFDSAAAVRLDATSTHGGAYASDFFSLSPRVTLSASARLTGSHVALDDQLGTELTGDHSYWRVNPSAGVTVRASRLVTGYGSFSESSRVPTPSELSCANPDDPCRLPNAFVADPPLSQVVARTWEGGMRGHGSAGGWTLSAFRTRTVDDILFISSGTLTNEGHFENVGDTLRQGIEASVFGRVFKRLDLWASYTYLQATFETPLIVSSPNHPDAVEGEITVAKGAQLPGIPRHVFKVNAAFDLSGVSVDLTLGRSSSQFLRGDEANLMAPLARGFAGGATARYKINRSFALIAQAANIFNSAYSTFGLLGDATDVLGGAYDDPRFVTPSSPRAGWVGVELAFR